MAQSFQVNFAFTGLSGGVGQLMQLNRQLRQAIVLQQQLGGAAGSGGGGGGNAAPAPVRQSRPPSTFVSRLAGLIGSTRVGMGGGGLTAMPLIGRMVGLLGATGPLGQGITIAVGALGALAATAHEAAASLQSFRMAAATSGGTGAEIAKLTSFGVAPGDIAGRAAALRERISSGSDPFAMAAGFRMLGGQRMPRPFGGTNEATDYLRIIEGLRGIKNAEEQLRLVRILGMEADMALIKTSDRVFRQMQRDAEFREKLFDPKRQQEAADFSGEMTRLGNAFENLKVGIGAQLIPEFSKAADGWANILNKTADWASKNGKIIDALFTTNFSALAALTKFGGIFGGKGKASDPHTAAVNKNTDALGKMTGIMREAGTFGGGARARGAIPEYLRGWTFDQAVAGKSISLGAFSP